MDAMVRIRTRRTASCRCASVLAAYIKRRSPIDAHIEGRITAVEK
jgi:hypothetical protein